MILEQLTLRNFCQSSFRTGQTQTLGEDGYFWKE